MLLRKLFLILLLLSVFSCKKPEDQQSPEVELTRRYCNDPYAVNYNDSFPGIPDNSRCRYPFDIFLGSWEIADSVFRSDDSYYSSEIKDISFQEVADERRNKLDVKGWCGSSDIHLIANRYGKALVINELEYPDSAQISCGTDTLMGYFQISILNNDSMNIEMINRSASGLTLRHKAVAIRKD